jgi:hypothetical protein
MSGALASMRRTARRLRGRIVDSLNYDARRQACAGVLQVEQPCALRARREKPVHKRLLGDV